MTETTPSKKQNGLPSRFRESRLATERAMDDTSKKSEPAVGRVVWGRRFLASTVVVPPDVAEHLNTDAMAVLAVIRNETQASGEMFPPGGTDR